MNHERFEGKPPPPFGLTIIKGSVHITANRDFVDFVLNSHPGKDLVEWVKNVGVPDEALFAMINHNPQLGVKGSYLGK